MWTEVDIPAGLTAGVDEAGRGPLAGPVVAGAVILDPDRPIDGLRDVERVTGSGELRRATELGVGVREQREERQRQVLAEHPSEDRGREGDRASSLRS